MLGPEHLLAVNLVIGDCLLAFVRNEPVDELLAKLLLHMRMLGRVNQDDTVLVEQQFVALHDETKWAGHGCHAQRSSSQRSLCLNSGRMKPYSPESCVEVVEATTMDLSCAEASEICARAKAITNERFRILGSPH